MLERQEFLDRFRPVLEREFPDNNHPEQKFSQVMQQLRDRGEVEFVDGEGTYRILSLSDDRAPDLGTSFPAYDAREYETTVGARSIPTAFRTAILRRYDATCPVSGVDHDRLLDVAHVLPWSDYADLRSDPGNVLPLSKTHHAAFDAGLFTLDREFRLHVDPTFETNSDLLRRTLFANEGERVPLPETAPLSGDYLGRHNEGLDWW
ncbi:HNH endonuclease [Halobacteriaceae archaeon GCM10025711]